MPRTKLRQMLQNILIEIVKKMKQTKPSKNNIKNFRRQESEEKGLPRGEDRMEINTASLSPKCNEYFAFVLSRTREENK